MSGLGRNGANWGLPKPSLPRPSTYRIPIWVRLVNRLGVTVDYLLADSVPDSDSNIMEQFKQIIDGQSIERKQMAVNVLRTIFAYFNQEGA